MAVQALGSDPDTSYRALVAVTELADRFGDAALKARGGLGQGQALVAKGMWRAAWRC